MEISELKARFFTLLREDAEFRYAVAGLLGLEEILRRLDRNEAELARLREDFNKMREDFNRKAEEDSKRFAAIEAELVKLREDMILGFRRHDEEFAKIKADMVASFKRHDEEFVKLRADMIEGFNLLRRHIDALGARWGLLSEQAFKGGLRSLIEKEFGFRVERWVRWDSEGYVHGHPSDVDLDIAVHNEKTILVEIKSHVGRPDVSTFKRKAEFYERIEGRKPSRLIIVTPYADENALETAKQLQIEVYTGV